jgi:hypothetical protein
MVSTSPNENSADSFKWSGSVQSPEHEQTALPFTMTALAVQGTAGRPNRQVGLWVVFPSFIFTAATFCVLEAATHVTRLVFQQVQAYEG